MTPAKGERGRRPVSATEAVSRWIDKDRGHNLDLQIATSHRVIGPDDFAHTLRPALQQAKADPVTESRRIGHGGHVALIIDGKVLRPPRKEMCPGPQLRGT